MGKNPLTGVCIIEWVQIRENAKARLEPGSALREVFWGREMVAPFPLPRIPLGSLLADIFPT